MPSSVCAANHSVAAETREKEEAPVGVEPTMADLQSGTGAGFARR